MDKVQKMQELVNALSYFGFDAKYSIYAVNGGRNSKFAIASESSTGGINTHTSFMTYEEMNAFLRGYNTALTRPL